MKLPFKASLRPSALQACELRLKLGATKVALMALGVGGCTSAPPAAEATVARSSEELYTGSRLLWHTRDLFVCWESAPVSQLKERTWVERAVTESWQAASAMRFRGWQECGAPGTPPPPGDQVVDRWVRILPDENQWPHVTGYGIELADDDERVILNFERYLAGTLARWPSFPEPAGWASHQTFLAIDFNVDGRTDIANVFDDGGQVSIDLHRNLSTQILQHERALTKTGGFASVNHYLVGDFTGLEPVPGQTIPTVHYPDIATIWNQNGKIAISINKNDRNGKFVLQNATPVDQPGGWSASQRFAAGNFNGDAWPDVATIFPENGKLAIDIHFNDHGTRFVRRRILTSQEPWHEPLNPRALAGDFNGDNWTDIAIAFQDGNFISIDQYLSGRTSGGFFEPVKHVSVQNGEFRPTQQWVVGKLDANSATDDLGVVFVTGRHGEAFASVDAYYGIASVTGGFTPGPFARFSGGWSVDQHWVAGEFSTNGGIMDVFREGSSIAFELVGRADPAERQVEIERTARHEFGHVMGFAHEQNRPDRPDDCSASTQQGSCTADDDKCDRPIGDFDRESIMNYCAHASVLSAGDKAGVAETYGPPPLLDQARFVTRQGGWNDTLRFLGADFDLDNSPDAAVAFNRNGKVGIDIRLNDDNGGFLHRSPSITDAGGWTDSFRFLAANFDSEVRPDIVGVFNEGGSISIDRYHQNPNGTFTRSRAETKHGAWSDLNRFVAADFDGTGGVDVLSFFAQGGQVWADLHKNDGSGKFAGGTPVAITTATSYETYNVVAGNFVGSAAPDLAAVLWEDELVAIDVYENDGSGHFGAWPRFSTLVPYLGDTRVLPADFDGDGLLDFATVYGTFDATLPYLVTVDFYLNEGFARFRPERAETMHGRFEPNQAFLVGDYDLTGNPDILLAFEDSGSISFDIHRNLGKLSPPPAGPLSFDNLAGWTVSNGTLVMLPGAGRDGGNALGTASTGFITLWSTPMTSQQVGEVGSMITIDFARPPSAPSSANYEGALQLYVEIPSLNLYNQFVGQAELRNTPRGQYFEVNFFPSYDIRTAMNGRFTDLRFSVTMNLPAATLAPGELYMIDNLRVR
jgi:hypothetical protein